MPDARTYGAQHVTCCIQMNVQYSTVELCMYLHANSVYSRSYSTLLDEGINTKMKLLFCDDHRNNVLLRLKFVLMTVESQNDCICSTPTSIRPKIILPPLQNGIDSALKNFTWHTAYCHLRTTSCRHTRTYVLPAGTSSTTSCISVICGRNNCTNTLCSSGDTYLIAFQLLKCPKRVVYPVF